MTPDQVENVALLLQVHGLLEVRYHITGIELALPPDDSKTEEKQKEDFKEKLGILEKEVVRSQSLMEFFEKDLERRILIAEKIVEDLEARPAYTAEEIALSKEEIAIALKQLDAFGSEIGLLKLKEGHFKEKLEAFMKRLEAIKPSAQPARAQNLLQRLLAMLKSIVLEAKLILSGKEKLVLEERPEFDAEKKHVEAQLAAIIRTPLPSVAKKQKQSAEVLPKKQAAKEKEKDE